LSGSATLATAATVPEPSTLVMLLTTCAPVIGWVFVRRRKQPLQTQ
jgi:hypothetical protein